MVERGPKGATSRRVLQFRVSHMPLQFVPWRAEDCPAITIDPFFLQRNAEGVRLRRMKTRRKSRVVDDGTERFSRADVFV